MPETLDLTHFPLERKAWGYLTAQGKNRPPFRHFVRWQELVSLASSLGKQITLKELAALIHEDVTMLGKWQRWQEFVYLASPLGKQTTLKEVVARIKKDATMLCDCHKNGGKFMGIRRLIMFPQGKRVVHPKPLSGVPKSLWPFIKTRQDGLPVVSGTVGIVRNENRKEFVAVPLCGAPLFLMRSRNGNGMPVEAFNEDTHLGGFLRNFHNQLRHVHTLGNVEDALHQRNVFHRNGRTKHVINDCAHA